MTRYLISIDLIGKDRKSDRRRLRRRLEDDLGATAVLYSQWTVSTEKTPEGLREAIEKPPLVETKRKKMPYFDVRKDRMLIVPLPDKVTKGNIWQRNLINSITLD